MKQCATWLWWCKVRGYFGFPAWLPNREKCLKTGVRGISTHILLCSLLMISIFFWHFCYMFFRYFFIYSYDEQNWNKNISFNEHDVINNFLARRSKLNEISRYDMKFDHRKNAQSNIEKFFHSNAMTTKKKKMKMKMMSHVTRKNSHESFKKNFIDINYK